MLRYLGAYTHRVAISNTRLVALSDGNVTFRWRDSAHGNKKRLMTLASMSSCAASCSICCRPASCASATSDSSPTATALLCCRCAFDCSATQRRWLLRQHHHPPIRLTHSGAAQSAVEPCASSNGSPPRNSCFALHLNQTGALHEALSTSSASARASARTRIPCLFRPKPLGCQPLQRPHTASASQHRCSIPPFSHPTLPNSVCA